MSMTDETNLPPTTLGSREVAKSEGLAAQASVDAGWAAYYAEKGTGDNPSGLSEAARRFLGYGCSVGTGYWLLAQAVPVEENKGSMGTGEGCTEQGVLGGPHEPTGVLEVTSWYRFARRVEDLKKEIK